MVAGHVPHVLHQLCVANMFGARAMPPPPPPAPRLSPRYSPMTGQGGECGPPTAQRWGSGFCEAGSKIFGMVTPRVKVGFKDTVGVQSGQNGQGE